MFKHILLPIDGSELSVSAARRGIELARTLGARVTILAVIEPLPMLDPMMVPSTLPADYESEVARQLQATLDRIRSDADGQGVISVSVTMRHNHPATAIVEAAQSHGADLIVMGSHGRRGAAAIILGSVTQKVLTQGHIPVLVLRQAAT